MAELRQPFDGLIFLPLVLHIGDDDLDCAVDQAIAESYECIVTVPLVGSVQKTDCLRELGISLGGFSHYVFHNRLVESSTIEDACWLFQDTVQTYLKLTHDLQWNGLVVIEELEKHSEVHLHKLDGDTVRYKLQ